MQQGLIKTEAKSALLNYHREPYHVQMSIMCIDWGKISIVELPQESIGW